MMLRQSTALAASTLLLTILAGCGEPVLDTDIGATLPAEGYRFSSILALVTVSEYEGRFGIGVSMDTNFAASSVRLRGSAYDSQKQTYSDIDETGVLEVLTFQPIPEASVNGRPIYALEELARFPESGCEVEMIGEGREVLPPEDPNYEVPHYAFYGTTHLDCPGASLTLETPRTYYEPGELVADSSATIHAQKIEEGE